MSSSINKTNTGNGEWGTPEAIIESARVVMGSIDVDPASNDESQQIVKAGVYFTKDSSSLDNIWMGNVWMNPPYGPKASIPRGFVNKLCEEIEERNVSQAIVLMKDSTEVEWFRKLMDLCGGVLFTHNRIKFIDLIPELNRQGPPGGNAIFYYGKNTTGFKQEFSKHGYSMILEDAHNG